MAVLAPAVWRVRPGGNNANGGGFDGTSYAGGTDRSQQNSAQTVFNGSTVTATTAGVGAVITFSGYTATAADVGNCLHITGGTNFIAGWYFITAQGGTTWTLDRNCTTGAGAAMTGNMGGAWADFVTNTTSSGPVINHNTVYILGSGTPNPSAYSPDYTVSAQWTPLADDGTNTGYVTFANDPSTPGYKAWPDTTGGMPLVRDTFHGSAFVLKGHAFQGLWFYAEAAVVAGDIMFLGASGGTTHNFFGCVFDQNSIDVKLFSSAGETRLFGCEAFSSSGGAGTANITFTLNNNSNVVDSCNFHDLVGAGAVRISGGANLVINSSIVAKCLGIGIDYLGADQDTLVFIKNCTIDGNGSSGIRIFVGYTALDDMVVMNNIISNHTAGGVFGIALPTGTASQAAGTRIFIDYNTFYNNTADLQALVYGPHDTHGGSDPFLGSTTQNYALA